MVIPAYYVYIPTTWGRRPPQPRRHRHRHAPPLPSGVHRACLRCPALLPPRHVCTCCRPARPSICQLTSALPHNFAHHLGGLAAFATHCLWPLLTSCYTWSYPAPPPKFPVIRHTAVAPPTRLLPSTVQRCIDTCFPCNPPHLCFSLASSSAITPPFR